MTSKQTLILLAATAVALGGCAEMRQRVIANDNNYCQSMGLQFGTPAFAQCRVIQDARRDQALSEGLDTMAKGLSNRRQPTTVIIEQ